MAKLNPSVQNPTQGLNPASNPGTLPSGIVASASPQPFVVTPPTAAKAAKAAKPKEAKTPRLSPQQWFDDNFSGQASDVLQIRRYPNRKEGFHCPTCGIAGSNAIIIKGKEGRGEPIELFEIDPETRELKSTGTINGFMVGATCLRKYGHVDINKLRP